MNLQPSVTGAPVTVDDHPQANDMWRHLADLPADTLDVQGDRVHAVAGYLRAEAARHGHQVTVWPVMHEQYGLIGGWQIAHGPCCPDRLDAIVRPATVRPGESRRIDGLGVRTKGATIMGGGLSDGC